MIQSEGELSKRSQLLADFKGLAENHAWADEIEPLLREALREHLGGATAQGRAHELRAEHIEAYHLALKLAEYRETRIASLTQEIRDYSRQVHDIGTGPDE